jgi:hypothetical protein
MPVTTRMSILHPTPNGKKIVKFQIQPMAETFDFSHIRVMATT